MSSIAIITARGGSKRIPRKNIREFCGKPMLVYSIEAALKANCFDEVMVSTDDAEIADISKKAGASIPFMRSERTSNDFATTDEVLLEVLDEYRKREMHFDSLCCIYPTAPFVTAEMLGKGMKLLDKMGAKSVMPVVRYSFPPQRSMVIKNGELKYQYEDKRLVRSQDLEPIYHDAGQFYCYKINDFIECKGDFSTGVIPLIIPESEVQDIDTEEDWKIAEMKYRLLHNSYNG